MCRLLCSHGKCFAGPIQVEHPGVQQQRGPRGPHGDGDPRRFVDSFVVELPRLHGEDCAVDQDWYLDGRGGEGDTGRKGTR